MRIPTPHSYRIRDDNVSLKGSIPLQRTVIFSLFYFSIKDLLILLKTIRYSCRSASPGVVSKAAGFLISSKDGDNLFFPAEVSS